VGACDAKRRSDPLRAAEELDALMPLHRLSVELVRAEKEYTIVDETALEGEIRVDREI
jgi:hypothetical protein